MSRRFNTSGPCFLDIHYMVDFGSRAEQIVKELIDKNLYFTVNQARQYGKTTMLDCLYQRLKRSYSVFLISLEGIGSLVLSEECQFCRAFIQLIKDSIDCGITDGISQESIEKIKESADAVYLDFSKLRSLMQHICSEAEKEVVLMMDEVDKASDNQVFLDFLALLRSMYMKRGYTKTFQSVILSSVYDVKNLRLKIDLKKEVRYNSPWNIAADFQIEMSFTQEEIAKMLLDYEQDHQTGMQIEEISTLIFEYTSGYPFLVSRICQLMDTKVAERAEIGRQDLSDKVKIWTKNGFLKAVTLILQEKNTLFDDMNKKLSDFSDLNRMLRLILFNGKSIPYNPDQSEIHLGEVFGYLKNQNGLVAVSNRIFETRLYNKFLSEEVMNSEIYDAASLNKNQFIEHGFLNVDLVMKKFFEYFTEIYADCEERFVEENGRRLFLLYLKPIINGVGNYYIEARTRNMRRTDVIIDYRGRQSVIEMKIWHGEEYLHQGELQLAGYLEDYHLDRGYLLSFNFHKKKKVGIYERVCCGKRILEVVV